MNSHDTQSVTLPNLSGAQVGAAVDTLMAPVRWQVVVRPIRRFGTIDRITWLLEGLSDVSALKLVRLDRGVATFDLLHSGRLPMPTLLSNALAPLGAAVALNRPGRAEVDLEVQNTAPVDNPEFGRG